MNIIDTLVSNAQMNNGYASDTVQDKSGMAITIEVQATFDTLRLRYSYTITFTSVKGNIVKHNAIEAQVVYNTLMR